jgi:plastocyanin
MLTRRSVLAAGGGFLAGVAFPVLAAPVAPGNAVEIRMRGNADGSKVWFDPIGVLVRPGQTVRWVNLDPGNSHTSTAYHPRNDDHALRIPDAAVSWNSDYLLPNESFTVTLTAEGVYDYYCIPHEHGGMVGRIIVGRPVGSALQPPANSREVPATWKVVPAVAEAAFPAVEDILLTGAVRRPL